MSFNSQSILGPPGGHSFSRPVSAEIPFRSGPRHCGQSRAWTVWKTAKHKTTKNAVEHRADVVSDVERTLCICSDLIDQPAELCPIKFRVFLTAANFG